MPITFAQPDPIAPSITAGAGAAEYAAKTLPSIYSIFENAARLRAEAGNRGGGGGGGGGNNTGIQVLPNGDSGAGLYQVEAQANRQQRAEDLGFEAQNDPVARHIQMQEDFKTKQTQQAQAAQALMLKQLNGDQGQQRPQGPPPINWNEADKTSLNSSVQAISDLQAQYEAGVIPEDAYQSLGGQAQQKFDALTKKKQAFDQQEQQKQLQQQSQATANQDSLAAVRTKHVNDALNGILPGIDDIPGMPKRAWMFNEKGVPTVLNEKERLNHQTNYYKMLETQAAAIPKAAETASKLQQADEIHKSKLEQHEQTMEHAAIKDYENRRDAVEKKVRDDNEKYVKADPEKREMPTEEGLQNTVAERMKAKGLHPTVSEFTDAWQKKRGTWKGDGQSAQPTQQDQTLMKQADPETVSALKSHVDTMPRLPNGQPNLLASTPEQLDQLKDFYVNHKKVGASAETAAHNIQVIDEAKKLQGIPAKGFEQTPPTTNRFARGASNIAGVVPDVAEEVSRRVGGLGKLTGITPERVNKGVEDFKRGAGVVGESTQEAGKGVRGVVDRIERGGANTYETFKRWLGR